MNHIEIGKVYIFRNPVYPNMIKIGKTTKSIDERCKELYNTSTPEEFEVLYWNEFENYSDIEILTHRKFDEYRGNKRREFFEIEPYKVINFLNELYIKQVKFNWKNEINQQEKQLQILNAELIEKNEELRKKQNIEAIITNLLGQIIRSVVNQSRSEELKINIVISHSDISHKEPIIKELQKRIGNRDLKIELPTNDLFSENIAIRLPKNK